MWAGDPDGLSSGGLNFKQSTSLVISWKHEPRPDLSATDLTWDDEKRGVDFGYRVVGADLPADATVALYWAGGTTEDSILSGPIALHTVRQAGVYGPYNIPGSALNDPPAGAKYLLVVCDHDHQIATLDRSSAILPLQDVQLSYGSGVRQEVSDYSFRVIEAVMRNSGQANALISSTRRTPEEQALAMYNNGGKW